MSDEPASPDSGLDSGKANKPSRFSRLRIVLLAITAAVILVGGLRVLGVFGVAEPGGAGSTAPMPADELSGWTPIFSEDFDTPAPLGTFLTKYAATFTAYPYPWTDTSRTLRSDPGYYYPEKTLSVANGVMDAWLHYDTELKRFLVAAPEPKLPKMLYGRFAFKLRAVKAPGYKIAPMLWPDSDRHPDDGEINMPEGDLNGRQFGAYSHHAVPAGTRRQVDGFPTGVNGQEWHVYETAWSPGKVEFFVDGKLIGTSTTAVPNTPMRWVLQFETHINKKPPATNAESHVLVDWMKVWKWDGQPDVEKPPAGQ